MLILPFRHWLQSNPQNKSKTTTSVNIIYTRVFFCLDHKLCKIQYIQTIFNWRFKNRKFDFNTENLPSLSIGVVNSQHENTEFYLVTKKKRRRSVCDGKETALQFLLNIQSIVNINFALSFLLYTIHVYCLPTATLFHSNFLLLSFRSIFFQENAIRPKQSEKNQWRRAKQI